MIVTLQPFVGDATAWNDLVFAGAGNSLLQTWEFGEAKRSTAGWIPERVVISVDSDVVGVVQAMNRHIGPVPRGLTWINRGPLLLPRCESDETVWRSVLLALRSHWVDRRRMVLRVALPIAKLPDAIDGYRIASFGEGYASTRIDLSRPLGDLRSSLEQKWRNSLNKAERLNVQVESDHDDRVFDRALRSYEGFVRERAFSSSVTPALLREIQTNLPAQRKMHVLTASRDGIDGGFAVIAFYGVTAEYLVGSSTAEGRQLNVGHLLLWKAMDHAKSAGYRWFDVGGLDEARTPRGILHFKQGLRGLPYRLAPEVEAFQAGPVAWLIRRKVDRAREKSG